MKGFKNKDLYYRNIGERNVDVLNETNQVKKDIMFRFIQGESMKSIIATRDDLDFEEKNELYAWAQETENIANINDASFKEMQKYAAKRGVCLLESHRDTEIFNALTNDENLQITDIDIPELKELNLEGCEMFVYLNQDHMIRFTGIDYRGKQDGWCEDFEDLDAAIAWCTEEYEIDKLDEWKSRKMKDKSIENLDDIIRNAIDKTDKILADKKSRKEMETLNRV